MRYKMVHASLQQAPEYSAVSYCWGAPVPIGGLKEIFVNGLSVRIRPTLYSFLKTLTIRYPGMSLWIDAICINQSDDTERNHQISIMGEIFGAAQEVLVWLGAGDDDFSYAMDHIGNAQPQTTYNPLIFSDCAEKLFRATYWTRRWVIQEFALAKEIKVVCGSYLTGWDNITAKINNQVLRNDPSLQQKLRLFKSLRYLVPGTKTLLYLMGMFRDARCTEPLDRAFALRGLAADGERLSPNYRDSVCDLFFRVLSMLPTEGVQPVMFGYRWQHRAAIRLSKYLAITRENLLSSLTSASTDRLFAVFEYVGSVTKVSAARQSTPEHHLADKSTSFPLEVQFGGDPPPVLRGSTGLRPGDLVYSLPSTARTSRGFYIAFGPSAVDQAVTGIIIEWPKNGRPRGVKAEEDNAYSTRRPNEGLRDKRIEFIKHAVLGGVSKCARNSPALSTQPRVLCHINRVTLVLLWLLDVQQLDHLWQIRERIQDWSVRTGPRCSCSRDEEPHQHDPKTGEHQNSTAGIQVSPGSHLYESWAKEVTLPWIDHILPAREDTDRDEDCGLQSGEERDFIYDATTALSQAAGSGFANFVEYLVSSGNCKVDWPDDMGRTPLWWAASNGHGDVVRILIDAGANKNCKDQSSGDTALITASRFGHEMVVRVLTKAGALTDLKDNDGENALMVAARSNNIEVARILIAAGAMTNYQNRDGESALMVAARSNNIEIVRILIAAGAFKEYQNRDGETALIIAARSNNIEIVRILIEAGVYKDEQNNKGETALMIAARSNSIEVVRILIKGGADMDCINKHLETALMIAARSLNIEMMDLLTEAGAYEDFKNNDGETARMIVARLSGNKELSLASK
jgi:ankyrin repeat protein